MCSLKWNSWFPPEACFSLVVPISINDTALTPNSRSPHWFFSFLYILYPVRWFYLQSISGMWSFLDISTASSQVQATFWVLAWTTAVASYLASPFPLLPHHSPFLQVSQSDLLNVNQVVTCSQASRGFPIVFSIESGPPSNPYKAPYFLPLTPGSPVLWSHWLSFCSWNMSSLFFSSLYSCYPLSTIFLPQILAC